MGAPSSTAVAASELGAGDEVAAVDRQAYDKLRAHAEQMLTPRSVLQVQVAADGQTLFGVAAHGAGRRLFAQRAGRAPVALGTPGDRTDAFVWRGVVDADAEPILGLFERDGVHGAELRWLSFQQPQGRTLPLPAAPRGEPMVARARPLEVFYRRGEGARGSELCALRLDGEPRERVLYRDARPLRLLDVQPDGARALAQRHRDGGASELLEVDLLRGEARVRSEGAGVRAARWLRGGLAVAMLLDEPGGGVILRVQPARGGASRALRVPLGEGRAHDLVVSDDGERVAALVDVGARRTLHWFELGERRVGQGAPPTPQRVVLPAGHGELSGFIEDGKALLLSWAEPALPARPWRVELASASAQPWQGGEGAKTFGLLAELTAVDVQVPVGAAATLPMNLYIPRDGHSRRPVLVLLPRAPGDSVRLDYQPLVRFFSAYGFAVAEPDLKAFVAAEAQASALSAAAGWLAEQSWADGERLVLWGADHGAALALRAAAEGRATPPAWRALVALEPSLAPAAGSAAATDWPLGPASWPQMASQLRAPLLAFQGGAPGDVPQIVGSLRAQGRLVEYFVAADDGQGEGPRASQAELWARALLFLRKHLEIR